MTEDEWYWGKPETDEERDLVAKAQDIALFKLVTEGLSV